MRWIFVRNAVNFAVNFCKKCGKMWWIIFFHRIHRFHRISYIILPQKLMQWIFVRNAVNFAVNFCKKCGEMRWNIYFHRIHRNHRISYKNSPHSPHFLQKITLKPRPRFSERSVWKIFSIYLFLLKFYSQSFEEVPSPYRFNCIFHKLEFFVLLLTYDLIPVLLLFLTVFAIWYPKLLRCDLIPKMSRLFDQASVKVFLSSCFFLLKLLRCYMNAPGLGFG